MLVCTTILESGIDIPNANTIIVENSENLDFTAFIDEEDMIVDVEVSG